MAVQCCVFKKHLLMLHGVFGVASHKVLLNQPKNHSRETHQNANNFETWGSKNKTHTQKKKTNKKQTRGPRATARSPE